MKVELFPFQKKAVSELRIKLAEALGSYYRTHIPQVVSLQAPTGSGKTIIMASLVEDIYYGTDQFTEQPEAIFVWLSDSPQLNEQSKQKFDLKADKIRFGQCVTIEDESFDMEALEDGHIYFLNTQKLGKAANLVKHSDTRQYTIWETLSNTIREKSDRLYFIIDEAHRGAQGREAGKATSIMQRFLKGYTSTENGEKVVMPPMPVVIGVSATAERFHKLIGDTTSTLQKCIVSANDVRASGLLKDRIVITFPEDPQRNNEMALLQAATDEWRKKCEHWYQYSHEQHYAQVNPIFLIQVLAGSGKAVSDTNLSDVLAKVEERLGYRFRKHEVVHTFGSISTLTLNGLAVEHVEPSDISEDKRIRLVLFKENLSTGWDCPRAETMMSFRHAEDATYIAQLLGRMVRTPLQCHILVDDSLNDVRLYLPYFNQNTVKSVIDELQSTEGGEIPTVIDSESLEQQVYIPWTVHTSRLRQIQQVPGQLSFDNIVGSATESSYGAFSSPDPEVSFAGTRAASNEQAVVQNPARPQQTPTPTLPVRVKAQEESTPVPAVQTRMAGTGFDREEITKFINDQSLLTYMVRSVKINNYMKSLLNLASLLTREAIFPKATDEVKADVVDMIRQYADNLRRTGKYPGLASRVLSFKLSVRVFDVFGESLDSGLAQGFLAASESDLDRQLRAADAKLSGYGFPNYYGQQYYDEENPSAYKIDCILFAADDDCIASLNRYAEKRFHELNDNYRKYIVGKSEKCRKQYSDIIADGDVVSKHSFTLPETISVKIEKDGKEYDNHLFADEHGIARIKLNGWEDELIIEEEKRPDFVCWLRNPPRASWAMCIPYEIGNETKATYPDFLIVRSDPQLDYIVDILEPHNPEFKDNLGKAKGFARYAENEPCIGRVQLIRTGKDAAGKTRFKRLDLSHGAVREKVLKAQNNEELDHIFDTDRIF